MRRLGRAFATLAVLSLGLMPVRAQGNVRSAAGDPPLAALISISPADAQGNVTITGAAGSVFPGAQVAVRNLYTEEIQYVQAGVTGGFSVTLFGPGNTPFWISPAANIPNAARGRPGSLPGGPGTIIYGLFPDAPQPVVPTTRIIIDGQLGDWATYPESALAALPGRAVYARLNQESLIVGAAIDDAPADYARIGLLFTLDGAQYEARFDPRQFGTASLARAQPNPRDLGALPVAAVQGAALEVRLPLTAINPNNPTVETASLDAIDFIGGDGARLVNVPVAAAIPLAPEERDGIVYLDSQMGENFTRFALAGPVAQGAGRWSARGRVNQLAFQPGDTLRLELDVTLDAPGLPPDPLDLRMRGQLSLQPLSGPDGAQAPPGLNAGNGWSARQTPGGLAVLMPPADVLLGEAYVPAAQIIRRGSRLTFGMRFDLTLPADLPPGRYVPAFRGLAQVGDGEPFAWSDSGLFGSGPGISRLPLTRLPLVLQVGETPPTRLVWTLFQDVVSGGSRGVLAEQDRGRYALSGRVRYENPTFILPPRAGPGGDLIGYPLEPYLLNLMPNAYDSSAAPLIPFLFPGGRLTARVTRPDGQVDDLGSSPIVQNRLSTAELDEAALFGLTTPVDVYRLTTLNPAFTRYVFDQYGEYQIELTGSLEDAQGGRYEGGGLYRVVVAEPFALLPAVLPGTPFIVGDAFNPGLRVLPDAAAEVTIRLRVYPLAGGAPLERVFAGRANRYGYFHAPETWRFDTPGEYVIDYEARFTDVEGKLWAGSLRSAGVVAAPGGALTARGQRGLDGYAAASRPAWFRLQQYQATPASAAGRLTTPYHPGDVLWIPAGGRSLFAPVIQAQDREGAYAAWLRQNAPGLATPSGRALNRAAVEGELPLATLPALGSPYSPSLTPDVIVNDAYAYFSAVRPDAAARQFVQGGAGADVPLHWAWDDVHNRQIGVGIAGSRPGDYLFLFGGAVVRNADAGVYETAAYASLAITIDPSDPRGARVYPPYRGEAGGPDGGPLLVIRDEPVNLFFHPTSGAPGQTLVVGDTLAIGGQLAPTLPSIVAVRITSPRGVVRQFEGVASAVGYFYDPSQDFVVDEAGVWTVEIRARHEGLTSAGPIEPPPPTGSVLGAVDARYEVYVVAPDAEPASWRNENRVDLAIPAAFPYNFDFLAPDGWRDVRVFHTVTTPAYILSTGPLKVNGRSFSFQYNPANLARVFPNLESNGQGVGPAASDVISLTFMVTGTDADGRSQARVRTFTILHDRLVSFQRPG